MRSSLFLAVAAAILVLMVDSLGTLRAVVSLDQLEASLAELPAQPLTEFERHTARGVVDEAVDSSWVLPRARILRANMLQRFAEESRSDDLTIQLYCDALAELGRAVVVEPQNARYLIGWANIRGLLGQLSCAEPNTSADLSRVITHAISSDPTNTNVLYAAGLISVWSGDLARARGMFRRVVELGMALSPGQVRQIVATLHSGSDVRQVVPARFPHVVRWGEAVARIFPERVERLQADFAALQLQALATNSDEFRRGAIPRALYWERLASLASARPAEEVRRSLDAEIGEHLSRGEDPKLGTYFSSRQALESLPIVPAAIPSDSRPTGTALTRWGFGERVAFDEAFASVGFFVSDRTLVRSIELWGQPTGVRVEPAGVKIFVSDDNQNWRELFDRFEVRSYSFERQPLIVVGLHVEPHRYWKVHFSDSRRERGLQNSLANMLRVYGVRKQRGEVQ